MDPKEKPTKYPSIFHTSLLFQLSGGALLPKKKNGLFLYYLHHAYNVVFAIYGLLTLAFELLILKDIYHNLNMLIKSCGMTMTHIMGVVKSYMLLKNDRKFVEIMDTLQDDKYKYEGFQKFSPLEITKQQKRIIDWLVIIVLLLATGVGLFGYSASLVRIITYESDGTYFTNDTTCQDFMPYPCYLIVPADTIPKCKWALFLYFIGLELYALPIGAFDCVFAAFITSIKANFLSIGGAFKTIRQRSLIKLGYDPTIEEFKDSYIPKLEEQMMKEITKCTVHLQTVLRLCVEIEDLFGYIILFQMIGSLIICAALLCLTSTADFLSPESISQKQFYGAMTFELSIFCYFGNELSLADTSILYLLTPPTDCIVIRLIYASKISTQSNKGKRATFNLQDFITNTETLGLVKLNKALQEVQDCISIPQIRPSESSRCDSIRTSIYESDWLSAGTPYKKYMLMTLCRLQRPVYITTGKFSNLTLATLLMVIRASFSVFTLYRSLM